MSTPWSLFRSLPLLSGADHPSARQFRFTLDQRQAVITDYEAGRTMASLAQEYDVKRESISRLLRRSGVDVRQRRVMSQTDIDQAVRLYADGPSLERIGKRLGWDHRTIHRHLRKRGVIFRGPNDWQDPLSTQQLDVRDRCMQSSANGRSVQ